MKRSLSVEKRAEYARPSSEAISKRRPSRSCVCVCGCGAKAQSCTQSVGHCPDAAKQMDVKLEVIRLK